MRTDDSFKYSMFIPFQDNNEVFRIGIGSNKWRYYSDTWYDVGIAAYSNRWYHIKIEFESSLGYYKELGNDKWRVYIDGQKYGDYNYKESLSYVNKIVFSTIDNTRDYHLYIDDIDYSWAPNYVEGRNKVYPFNLIKIQSDPVSIYPVTPISPLDSFEFQVNCSLERIYLHSVRVLFANSSWHDSWINTTYDISSKLWKTPEIDGSYFQEGDYAVWVNATDIYGFSTFNCTDVRIMNHRPKIEIDNDHYNEFEQYQYPYDFRYDTNINLTVHIFDYEEDAYWGESAKIVLSSNHNITIFEWTSLVLQSANWFELRIEKTDMNATQNGFYDVMVRVSDARGYVYEQVRIEFIFFNPSAGASLIDDDDGGGNKSSAPTNTVIMVVIIGCLGGGGAVAVAVILKARRGTSYRKDVKTIPKKFGKVGKFSSNQAPVSKVSLGSGSPPPASSSGSSNVFQIGKSTDKKD